jgi:hypothetical protein
MTIVPHYILSVNVGQVHEYSAIVLAEIHGRRPEHTIHVREATRLPLGTSYPDVADEIARRYAAIGEHLRRLCYGWDNPREWLAYRSLVIDITGVGRPPYDELVKRRVRAIPITFVGGTGFSLSPDGWGYHVAKVDLVSSLAIRFQCRPPRILISERLPQVEALLQEFLRFRQKVHLRGPETAEAWRERDHDDLAFSVTMATWYAAYAYNVRAGKVLGV